VVRPSGFPEWVILVGLGDLPPRLLPDVAVALRAELGIGWRPGPPLDRPSYAFNEARRQFHAPAIVRRLAGMRGGAARGAPVVGVLPGDLFLPDGEYVLGEADRDAGAGLFALARLAGTPDQLRRRAQVEALHVVGHLLGLSTCLDYRCAMFASRDAADADRKGSGLCASCRAALGLK
jgi:archaemetzincin